MCSPVDDEMLLALGGVATMRTLKYLPYITDTSVIMVGNAQTTCA